MNSASSWKNAISSASDARTFGRCTFTITSRPSRRRGGVHLSQARRAERLGIERREQLAQPAAQLLLDRALHLLEGDRADVVLQPLELLDVRLGKQVRPRGQHLAELHVRRSQLDEPFAKAGRLLVALGELLGRQLGLVVADEGDQSLLSRDVAKTEAREQADDGGEAGQVRG